ncbi:hypothetical protein Ari01nite_91410 [Paractinoplanes rishiriensis]|uniref:PilZ domain-containing protein n=1 Tax=Paractinoplanes rishiriensis TaxID=1050105 RepID=A0A919MVQ8_9ACTN|nr:hypothetical protein Ari01nite_91410 [Actinoplanes rishiriensis]
MPGGTPGLPEVGDPIFLVLGEGVNFRSRLESVDGGSFSVAAPLETIGPAALEPGREFDVFWVPPRTRVVMPCRLIGMSDTAPFRWTLLPTGDVRQANRREFVRGGGGAAVQLDTETGTHSAQGALLDISEGGLRCWIDEALPLTAGDGVQATVWLGTDEVSLLGTVHTVREAPHGDPGQHLILTFDSKDDVAQVIRQYILAWEIGERRRARANAS